MNPDLWYCFSQSKEWKTMKFSCAGCCAGVWGEGSVGWGVSVMASPCGGAPPASSPEGGEWARHIAAKRGANGATSGLGHLQNRIHPVMRPDYGLCTLGRRRRTGHRAWQPLAITRGNSPCPKPRPTPPLTPLRPRRSGTG